MILASEIVYSAYRQIQILGAAGRGYSGSQGTDGLNILNRLLDSWNTEKLAIYAELRSVFDLTVNQQDYEIGPAADAPFDVTRPTKIDRASIITQFTSSQPLELPIAVWTYQQWQAINVKDLPTPIPQGVYYETSYPSGVLHFWPYPSEDVQVALYVNSQLTQVSALSTEMELPPGYARALIMNLAVEMAPAFPRAVLSAATVQAAVESKAAVKRLNVRPLDIQCDRGVLSRGAGYAGRFNIYTGNWNSQG